MSDPDSSPPPRSIVIAPGRVNVRQATNLDQDHGDRTNLSQSRSMVLATLLLVTGALGLPLLWRSDQFGRRERWAWALIVTLYTAILIAGMIYLVRYSVRQAFPVPPGG
ncbi:MAG: hypothetical protein AAGJ40_06545 [Planctomycetota bacterium]